MYDCVIRALALIKMEPKDHNCLGSADLVTPRIIARSLYFPNITADNDFGKFLFTVEMSAFLSLCVRACVRARVRKRYLFLCFSAYINTKTP